MTLNLKCETDHAILLLGCKIDDSNSVLRFPTEGRDCPGLFIEVNPSRPINDQLIQKAAVVLNDTRWNSCIDINKNFSSKVELKNQKTATLYVGVLQASDFKPTECWPTLPELLKAMPKNRARLAYLKAWQILAGAEQVEIKSFDVDDFEKDLR